MLSAFEGGLPDGSASKAPEAATPTDAELRVLPYFATYLSFREIAERLVLSRHA